MSTLPGFEVWALTFDEVSELLVVIQRMQEPETVKRCADSLVKRFSLTPEDATKLASGIPEMLEKEIAHGRLPDMSANVEFPTALRALIAIIIAFGTSDLAKGKVAYRLNVIASAMLKLSGRSSSPTKGETAPCLMN